MKTYSSKSAKGRLDKLVGSHYRSKPCEKCGSTNYVQWVHIRSRKYLSVRWEETNNLSLCAGCHRWAHDQPDAFTKWIDNKYPGRLDKLNAIFRAKTEMKKYQMEELLNTKLSLLTSKGSSGKL
jgi:hypothetical protein